MTLDLGDLTGLGWATHVVGIVVVGLVIALSVLHVRWQLIAQRRLQEAPVSRTVDLDIGLRRVHLTIGGRRTDDDDDPPEGGAEGEGPVRRRCGGRG